MVPVNAPLSPAVKVPICAMMRCSCARLATARCGLDGGQEAPWRPARTRRSAAEDGVPQSFLLREERPQDAGKKRRGRRCGHKAGAWHTPFTSVPDPPIDEAAGAIVIRLSLVSGSASRDVPRWHLPRSTARPRGNQAPRRPPRPAKNSALALTKSRVRPRRRLGGEPRYAMRNLPPGGDAVLIARQRQRADPLGDEVFDACRHAAG